MTKIRTQYMIRIRAQSVTRKKAQSVIRVNISVWSGLGLSA